MQSPAVEADYRDGGWDSQSEQGLSGRREVDTSFRENITLFRLTTDAMVKVHCVYLTLWPSCLHIHMYIYHKGTIAPLYTDWPCSITPIHSENQRFRGNRHSLWNLSSRKGTYGQNMGVLKKDQNQITVQRGGGGGGGGGGGICPPLDPKCPPLGFALIKAEVIKTNLRE